MSKRQALGLISNIPSHFNAATAPKAAAAAATALASKQSQNDENEPIKLTSIKSSQQSLVGKTGSTCYDFEIFQEDDDTNSSSKNATASAFHKTDEKKPSECFNKENQFKLEQQKVQEVEEEEEDEEDEDYCYEREDDSEEEEEEEEEEDDEYNDEDVEEEEEEGISRLNLGNLIDLTNESASKNENSKHKEASSSSNGTNLLNIMMDSPMVLDDTIKFQSLLSNIEENEHDNDNDDNLLFGDVDSKNKHDDDDEEETLSKFKAMERENILMNCLEYKDDILKYMKKMEREYKAKSNYMKKQQDINGPMRSILIDWLVEVSEEYKLSLETLYLAVNYTDRFLSQMSVLRGKLQLVGTASMYIASKYEEITPPDISEFVYITDDTYTRKQVLRMEHLLLKILDFRMNAPTANWFLMYFLRFIKQGSTLANTTNGSHLFQRIECLSRYLAELSLIDGDTFLPYMPSQIAASAIYLALHTFGKTWTKQIGEITGFGTDLADLKQCIIHLYKAMQNAPQHPQQAIQEKYKVAKYENVSLIDPPKSLPAYIYN